jgi:hypothetical protein
MLGANVHLARSRRLILARLALAAAAVTLMLLAFGRGTANAEPVRHPGEAPLGQRDPGFCGVRDDYYFEAGYIHYVVYNKCSRAWKFAVYLPGIRRPARTGCRTVRARSRQGYIDQWADENWYVRNC